MDGRKVIGKGGYIKNISRQTRRNVRERGLIYSQIMNDWVKTTCACRKFKLDDLILFFFFHCFFPQFALTIISDKHLRYVRSQQQGSKLNADTETD